MVNTIVVMSKSELNKQTAAQVNLCTNGHDEYGDVSYYYTRAKFNGQENSLTLLDVDANNDLQQYRNAEDLAEYFIERGLTSNLESIYVIASTVNSEQTLFQFAHDFTAYLQKQWQKKINVYVSADRTYSMLIVHPPGYKNNSDWCIYGLNAKEKLNILSFELSSFDSIIKHKQPVWRGQNIYDYLHQVGRTPYFTAEEKKYDHITTESLILDQYEKELTFSGSSNSLFMLSQKQAVEDSSDMQKIERVVSIINKMNEEEIQTLINKLSENKKLSISVALSHTHNTLKIK